MESVPRPRRVDGMPALVPSPGAGLNGSRGEDLRSRLVFVVDGHEMFRSRVAACLRMLSAVTQVSVASSPAAAWADPGLLRADLVIVDPVGLDGLEFIRRLRDRLGMPVVVCTAGGDEASVMHALDAGAVGVIAKEALARDALCSIVEAALHGSGVISPRFLALLQAGGGSARSSLAGPASAPSPLTRREQQVLALIAEGRTTQEVALELSYSERTVKNVLHDAMTKLGVRSRAHAVAFAVRNGFV